MTENNNKPEDAVITARSGLKECKSLPHHRRDTGVSRGNGSGLWDGGDFPTTSCWSFS